MSISVCMATYNGEAYIKKQLESILVQLKEDDEIIISDDLSTDNTLNIIRSFNDPRIKIYKDRKYGSPAYNFENALKHASGDYIFLSDQDDVWLFNKVISMTQLLDKFDLVVSDCKVVDENLKIIHESFFSLLNSGPGFWKNFKKNTFLGCCMAFKKDILFYVLPFPTNIFMHDIWIGHMVELKGKTFFLDQPLMLYRRHGNNASSAAEKSTNSFCYKIKYRFLLLYTLFKRIYLK